MYQLKPELTDQPRKPIWLKRYLLETDKSFLWSINFNPYYEYDCTIFGIIGVSEVLNRNPLIYIIKPLIQKFFFHCIKKNMRAYR